MKKLIFALMIMMGMFVQSANAQEDHTPIIELQFGRVSLNCGGFGICVFKIHITRQDIKELVPVLMNGALMIKMSPDYYKANKKHFSNNVFVIDEDYLVDAESMKLIGGKSSYNIKRGKYPVKFDPSTNTYNCTF